MGMISFLLKTEDGFLLCEDLNAPVKFMLIKTTLMDFVLPHPNKQRDWSFDIDWVVLRGGPALLSSVGGAIGEMIHYRNPKVLTRLHDLQAECPNFEFHFISKSGSVIHITNSGLTWDIRGTTEGSVVISTERANHVPSHRFFKATPYGLTDTQRALLKCAQASVTEDIRVTQFGPDLRENLSMDILRKAFNIECAEVKASALPSSEFSGVI
jgi:hypothetical protein